MSSKIKICENSLRIIILVQAKKELALTEAKIFSTDDWYIQTLLYFKGIPCESLLGTELEKTNICFYAILKVKVTADMKQMVFEHGKEFYIHV